jgi:hypothetical protein
MASVNIPDDPNWARLFRALAAYAQKQQRIQRQSKIELHGGKDGVRVEYQEGYYSPDQQ